MFKSFNADIFMQRFKIRKGCVKRPKNQTFGMMRTKKQSYQVCVANKNAHISDKIFARYYYYYYLKQFKIIIHFIRLFLLILFNFYYLVISMLFCFLSFSKGWKQKLKSHHLVAAHTSTSTQINLDRV